MIVVLTAAACGTSATAVPSATAAGVAAPVSGAAPSSPQASVAAPSSSVASPQASTPTSGTASPPAVTHVPSLSAAPSVSAAPSPPATGSDRPVATPRPSTPPAAGRPPAIALRPLVTGLDSPVGIVAAPDGSNRLFIVEQGGEIRVVADRALLKTPFLDVRDQISRGGERGLLGLAFHPNAACNGRFFVNYTGASGDTIVEEYRISPSDPNVADPQPVAELLHIHQPFPNHNGGDLVFGPDGFLYIGMGDGGSGGDPQGNGQRLDTLLAKMLRIDVDHPAAGKAYGIPAGNCAGCPGDPLPEIYAYGLRNPWRFSFDRATGDLWIGDVGQGRYEEVDHVTAATGSRANFGWNRTEGRHCYPSGIPCDGAGLTLPVAEYDHSGGDCSITGGYVYRGSQIPGLAGQYLFSDYCSGTIRIVEATPPEVAGAATVALETQLNIVSFGEGPDGELFVADVGSGQILEIVAAP